jgi:tetratricopeptide (TPR) repeat protein
MLIFVRFELRKNKELAMKKFSVVALAAACLTLGMGIGYAAKVKGPGMTLVVGKPAKEAGLAALQEAERLAGSGSWELLGVARVYYLSGDKASDLHRVGQIYADAGENAKAEEYFQKALASDPKDDRGQAEVGAWYIRTGQREKGEELMAKAFARSPDELWHYVRVAEALLAVPAGK